MMNTKTSAEPGTAQASPILIPVNVGDKVRINPYYNFMIGKRAVGTVVAICSKKVFVKFSGKNCMFHSEDVLEVVK
jgi:hypothetical protein